MKIGTCKICDKQAIALHQGEFCDTCYKKGLSVLAKIGILDEFTADIDDPSAQAMMCSLVSHFKDDVKTECSQCQRAVYHRPYVPAYLEKVCIECVINKKK